MTTVVLSRRNLLAAGGSVLATGVSGLLFPARAQGLAPTDSMSGGSNNYRRALAGVVRPARHRNARCEALRAGREQKP